MKLSLLLCGALATACAFALPAQAAEYARTVRLGNCVIKPGTTVLKLVECAGEPITKNTSGVNLKSGKLEEVWLYKSAGRTVVIHVAAETVTKVEVKTD